MSFEILKKIKENVYPQTNRIRISSIFYRQTIFSNNVDNYNYCRIYLYDGDVVLLFSYNYPKNIEYGPFILKTNSNDKFVFDIKFKVKEFEKYRWNNNYSLKFSNSLTSFSLVLDNVSEEDAKKIIDWLDLSEINKTSNNY